MKYLVPLSALAILIVGAVLLIPDGERPAEPLTGLPWQIEILPDGASRVFGITLGQTTLGAAQEQLGDDRELAIMAAPGEAGNLEMYYGHFSVGVLAGKLILVADLAPGTLSQLRERAYRKSGRRKYHLHPDDLPIAYRAPVKSITFVSGARLDEEMAHLRFGAPAEIIHSSEYETHLLYPDKGLDFILNQEGRDVLQYVAPRDFITLRKLIPQAPGTDESTR